MNFLKKQLLKTQVKKKKHNVDNCCIQRQDLIISIKKSLIHPVRESSSR